MTDFLSKLRGRSNPSAKPKSGAPNKSGSKNGHSPTQNGQTSQNGKSSNARIPKPWYPLYKKWWAWAILAVGATTVGGGLATLMLVQRVDGELPDTSEVLTYKRDGTLTLRANDGTILQQLGPATREEISYDKIPPRLVEAFIASEDQNFFKHGGVDYNAIARAVYANLTAGEVVEGGSTITQQIARVVYLNQEQSVLRKLREAMLAQKIERDIDKEKILERYLNLVYLGSGAYGVADAAWIFFSKPVDQLTLSEMAMIAGLPPAPSAYSPLVDLEAATERRNIVLSRMVDVGYITESERQAAVAEPITLNPSQPRNLYSEFPYFTSYIQQELPKYVTQEQIDAGGLTVETTLNPKWQRHGQEVINSAIERYGPRQRFKQAALVAVDPKTGEIRTMVGGNDFNESQFNRAVQAMRQPGSTFKAFVYTAAIAAGFSPYKNYMDAKLMVDGYEPENYGRKFRGNVSMRDALTSSINIVAVKVLIDVGFDPVVEMAQRMGIKSKLVPAYSLALGTSEVNLLEITSAYGTLANKGLHVEPHGIVRITDRYGKVIYDAKFEAKRAVDEDTAAIMTWMLRGVVQGGTGSNAALSGRQVAGKTGTSEKARDLWFIGYIPQLSAGVWLGNDNNGPTRGASSTAALIWRNFMRGLVDDIPKEDFPKVPRLSGRRGTIKAEPVRPRRMKADKAPSSREGDEERRPSRRSQEESRPSQEQRPRGESVAPRSVEPAYEPPAAPPPASYEPPPAPVAPPPPPPPAPAPPPPPAVSAPPPAAPLEELPPP